MSNSKKKISKPLNEPVKMDSLWGETAVKGEALSEEQTWFREAKFAMFIHWGLYSEPAGIWEGKRYYGISEWLMHQAEISVADYEKLAPVFNPVDFDAEAIAQLALDAGMKYIVITTKHHDGFAMFRSKASRYNIIDATPFGRDPMKELAEACKRHGLKLGFYYSQSQDWHEKDAMGNTWDFDENEADFQKYLREKAIPQVREILTEYGEIGIIWFDTPVGISKEQVRELRAMVKESQPHCLVNSRIGQGLGDFTTLGDSEFPDHILGGLWESIDTHNHSWAFSKLDIDWKSAAEVIHRLVSVLCKGGNFMFNIGLMGKGGVPEESSSVLREAGVWVKNNGEAIYGAEAVEMGNQGWIEATRNKGKTYLFIREWPLDGRVWLPGLEGEVMRASTLEHSQELEMKEEGGSRYLAGPQHAPDSRMTVISLEHESPVSFAEGQWVVPGATSELLPHSAKLEGVSFTRGLRWMEIFGDWRSVPVLQDWEGEGSGATWSFYVPKSGSFFLDIEYSCGVESDLKEGVIDLDGTRINFVPVYTGDTWNKEEDGWGRAMPRFMTRRIGLVQISGEGSHTLTIEPSGNDSGSWIRVSKLRLIGNG